MNCHYCNKGLMQEQLVVRIEKDIYILSSTIDPATRWTTYHNNKLSYLWFHAECFDFVAGKNFWKVKK